MFQRLFLILTILCSATVVEALPLGNPGDPSLLSPDCSYSILNGLGVDYAALQAGYYGDFVYNRHFKNKTTGKQNGHLQINTNAFLGSLVFFDRLSLFTTLGTTNFLLETQDSAGPIDVLELNSSFSWSAGGRAELFDWNCFTLGIEGQYFYCKPRISRLTVADTFSFYSGDLGIVKYREYQFGAGVAYRIRSFSPYVGVKCAHAHVQPSNAGLQPAKNAKDWGYAVGVSIVECQRIELTAEARFGDEKALHINGQVRF